MKANKRALEAQPEVSEEVTSPLLAVAEHPDFSRASLSNDDIRDDDLVEDLLTSMGQPHTSLNRHLQHHPEMPNPFEDEVGYAPLGQDPHSHVSPNASISTVSTDVAPSPGLRLKLDRVRSNQTSLPSMNQIGTTIDYPDEKTMPAIIHLLFPWVFEWRTLPWYEKISGVLMAPMWILLRLTVAVAEDEAIDSASEKRVPVSVPVAADDGIEDEGDVYAAVETPMLNGISVVSALQSIVPQSHTQKATWHRWMACINILTFPLVMAVAFVNLGSKVGSTSLPVWALSLLIGAVLAGLFALATNDEAPPRGYLGICYLGFAAGMVWIYFIANEVVGLLQALGLIWGISEAIMGLTFFAWGNSLGDLVTDLAMARMGYGNLAMGACFGSPMLSTSLHFEN
jgi:Ca2+/Na+ antiporter